MDFFPLVILAAAVIYAISVLASLRRLADATERNAAALEALVAAQAADAGRPTHER